MWISNIAVVVMLLPIVYAVKKDLVHNELNCMGNPGLEGGTEKVASDELRTKGS